MVVHSSVESMLLGKKKESKFADGVSPSYRLWHDKLVQAVRLAMPPECPYTVVHVGDLVGVSFAFLILEPPRFKFLTTVASKPALHLHLRQND